MALVLYVADPKSVPHIGASPPSWMCEALLAAKGLAFQRVALSFERGEHKADAMLSLNPRGSIPVLMHDDRVVHETFAIMLYVESLAPGHLPEDATSRARALTRFFEADYVKSACMAALASMMKTGELGDTSTLARELDRWNLSLAETHFAAGPDPTLADFVLFAYLATLDRLRFALTRWPSVATYLDRARASGFMPSAHS